MKYQDIAMRVVEYVITRDLGELTELTRYKIAGIFGINKNYLSEKFKEETKMTVWGFINFEKMKRAEKLLTNRHDLSVRKISEKVGFARCCQFREKFKKIYGLKPGKYRRLCKT